MARYMTVHTIACVTRQNLKRLADKLDQDDRVGLIRMVADTIEGAMVCEFEAASKDVLMAFLSMNHMHTEKIMAVELEFPKENS